ncbi:MAG: hypothetical protein KGI69_01390 [Patescibacteria group bacterium]|nr:hypothetical protein [Patescibacteria group bacterium]
MGDRPPGGAADHPGHAISDGRLERPLIAPLRRFPARCAAQQLRRDGMPACRHILGPIARVVGELARKDEALEITEAFSPILRSGARLHDQRHARDGDSDGFRYGDADEAAKRRLLRGSRRSRLIESCALHLVEKGVERAVLALLELEAPQLPAERRPR